MAMTSAERYKRWKERHDGDPTAAERKRKWKEAHPEEAKAKNREYVRRYRQKQKEQTGEQSPSFFGGQKVGKVGRNRVFLWVL